MKLLLSPELSLPADAATQTFLVVGKRGSGKSTTCVRLAEQFYAAKVPFVVVDPVDTWWGLKASKDGKGPGLKDVYVFGGRHADLPLEPTGGALVADTVVEHRISAVLSVKHFSGRERARFVSEFCDRLFRKNAGDPLHLFLEEAHEVAPQNPMKGQGEEEMLGRVTRIWKLGRSSGLGGSAITQRPASLSKNITTQAEILIVHRMLGPQDVAAVKEWIKYHGESDEILKTLSELKTGEAWVWAPDFPEGKPIGLIRTRIYDRETFDSSATPKAGEHRKEPKVLAPVDLGALALKMAGTIERARAEDPRELRKKILELERTVQKLHTQPGIPSKVSVKRVEVPVLSKADRALIERVEKSWARSYAAAGAVISAVEKLQGQYAAIADLRSPITNLVDRLSKIHSGVFADAVNAVSLGRAREEAPRAEGSRPLIRAASVPAGGRPAPREGDGGDLSAMHRKMLTVLAQHPDGLTKGQVLLRTGYSSSGSTSKAFADLSRNLWIESLGLSRLRITDFGLDRLGPYTPLPQGAELRRELLEGSTLTQMERALLRVVCDAYPEAAAKGKVLEGAGYSSSGSTSAAFSRLVRYGYLKSSGPSLLRAAAELF